ncbi:HAD-IA family hydrolase [Sphingomonas sp. MMS24-JH45]
MFDCDGTLVDSQANIYRAMEAAYEEAGLPAPGRAAIRGIVGLSLVEAVAALSPGAPPSLHADLAARYKQAFWRMRADGSLDVEPMYDGLVALLDRLAADGWRLGVATGKSDRGLGLLLAHHGLTDRFVTLQTADRHPSKPHPAMLHAAMAEAGADPHMSVMIGDTSYDMAMACAAGVRAIGVTWGYHDEALLREAGGRHRAPLRRHSRVPGVRDPAFGRWAMMAGVRIAVAIGGAFGVVLMGRSHDLTGRLIGAGIVVAALWMIATVPRALAHRWRSPE